MSEPLGEIYEEQEPEAIKPEDDILAFFADDGFEAAVEDAKSEVKWLTYNRKLEAIAARNSSYWIVKDVKHGIPFFKRMVSLLAENITTADFNRIYLSLYLSEHALKRYACSILLCKWAVKAGASNELPRVLPVAELERYKDLAIVEAVLHYNGGILPYSLRELQQLAVTRYGLDDTAFQAYQGTVTADTVEQEQKIEKDEEETTYRALVLAEVKRLRAPTVPEVIKHLYNMKRSEGDLPFNDTSESKSPLRRRIALGVRKEVNNLVASKELIKEGSALRLAGR